jgi:hypothetical protein
MDKKIVMDDMLNSTQFELIGSEIVIFIYLLFHPQLVQFEGYKSKSNREYYQ